MNTFLCRISDSQLLTQFSVTSLQSLSPQPNRLSSIMNFFIFAIFSSIAALASAQTYVPYTNQEWLVSGYQITYESGQKMFSANGQYRLDLQADGNLVVYNVPTGHHVWSSGTDRKSTRLNSSHVLRSRMPSSA